MAVPVFPSLPGFMFPVKRAVAWDTVKADALSGKRTRFANWTYPIYHYEIGFDFLRADPSLVEWQTLEGFINSMAGGYGLFGFNDVNDNSATAIGIGISDGVTTQFQLVRSLGGFTVPVFLINPVPTPIIYDNGNPVSSINYTIGPTGIVTFTAPRTPGDLLAWTGSYYWPCRFDDDVIQFSNYMKNLWELKSLKFSSEKLP